MTTPPERIFAMLIYLLIVNAIGFIVMLYDKYMAKNNLWRIPEISLLGVAVIGGSLGCWVGMYVARHKTKHLQFVIGIPVILVVQGFLLYWYLS
ncbi:MAG: DUF1294 domain-containing protein [Oscillospiraceae bacterium]|nr:DUF1294 domain-containing protein [Oscillospiraceae bacterium]